MEIIIELNNEEYIAEYNEQTGYFEAKVKGIQTGGIYQADITINDERGQISKDTIDIQVLKKEEVTKKENETLAYFFDKKTFQLKDILKLEKYQLTIDEETNAISSLYLAKRPNAKYKDFVFIKEDNEILYQGIIQEIINENGENKHEITTKYITNIFDRKLVVKNEELIKQEGIEDFIKYTIENEFTKSSDKLLNMNFIDVEILTHTKIQKSIENENGIYNFHTFSTNAVQNYNLSVLFKSINKRLQLTIAKKQEEKRMIDTTLADITNYTEIFEKDVTSKVTVVCEDKTEHTWYLLNDRTITQNANDENRAEGNIEVVYTQNAEDSQQTALNVFKR